MINTVTSIIPLNVIHFAIVYMEIIQSQLLELYLD